MSHPNPWVGDEWVEASAQLVIQTGDRELIWDLGVFDPTDPTTYTVNGVEEALHRAVNQALDSGFLSADDEVLLRIGPRERRFKIALRSDGRYRLEEQHRRLRSGTTERRRRTYFPNPNSGDEKIRSFERELDAGDAKHAEAYREELFRRGSFGVQPGRRAWWLSDERGPRRVRISGHGGRRGSLEIVDEATSARVEAPFHAVLPRYQANPADGSAQRGALHTWLFRYRRALMNSRTKAAKSRQRDEVLGAIAFAAFAGIITDVERIRLIAWVRTGQWERSTAEIDFLEQR